MTWWSCIFVLSRKIEERVLENHGSSPCRSNIDAGIRNKGGKDLNIYNGSLLEAIQKAAAAVQKPNPYPTWKPVPEDFTPKEVFGAERLPGSTVIGEAVNAQEPDSLPELDEVCAHFSTINLKCESQHLR
jgi:hypothetical protein